jgi:hypothetical protein
VEVEGIEGKRVLQGNGDWEDSALSRYCEPKKDSMPSSARYEKLDTLPTFSFPPSLQQAVASRMAETTGMNRQRLSPNSQHFDA